MPEQRITSFLARIKEDNRVPVLVGLVCLGLLLAWPNFVPRPAGIPDVRIASYEGAVLAADYAARQNNLTAEAFYYAKAHRLNPGDFRILDKLFTAHLTLGEMDAALPLAETLVLSNPHHARARLVLAAAAVRNDDADEAVRHAGMIISGDAERVTAGMIALWAGQMSQNEGVSVPALVELENETVMPGPALRTIALFHEFSGNIARAEEVYETVIKTHGLLSVDHALDFLFFLHRAGLEEQRDLFFKNIGGQYDGHAVYRHIRPLLQTAPEALAVTPAEAIARGFYDIADSGGQSPRDKLAHVRIAHWMAPSRRGVMTMADILAEMSLLEEAIAAYETIRHDAVFGETVRASIALLHEANDAPNTAIALLEQEVAADDSRFSVKLVADMLRRQEKYDLAEGYYTSLIDKLVSVERHDWELFYGRGIVRERLGNWPGAEADLLLAKDLSGNRPYVLNYLGYSWIDNGENVEQGLAMVEQAVQAEPNNGYFVDSLGWAFYRLGDFQKAVKFLEHATMLQPGDPEIIDHLGDALWQVGRQFEARYQWQRVLTLDISEEKREQIKRKIDIGVFEDHQGQKLAI